MTQRSNMRQSAAISDVPVRSYCTSRIWLLSVHTVGALEDATILARVTSSATALFALFTDGDNR
jgi:hypothetical protein